MTLDPNKLKADILSDMRVELSDEFDRNFERKGFFSGFGCAYRISLVYEKVAQKLRQLFVVLNYQYIGQSDPPLIM